MLPNILPGRGPHRTGKSPKCQRCRRLKPRLGFLKKEPQGLGSKCMISCLGSCRRVSVMSRGWEASEKEGALNGCYSESSATVIVMVSANPGSQALLSLLLPPAQLERSEKGFQGGEDHAASPPPMLLLEEKGSTRHPATPSKLLSPEALIFQPILHSHLCCLESGDGQILRIS